MSESEDTSQSARQFSGGIKARELPGYWRRDWQRAYEVLTREHADEQEPRGRFRRWWHRAKILFLGLAYKLTPPRRILFVICLVLALVGIRTEQVQPTSHPIDTYQSAPLLFVSVLGLIFLLALELADRVRFRDELEVARQLQRNLLPAAAPEVRGYEFAFSYRAANTIGGDYYDFIPVSEERLALVVGDASGHGIAAAMLMAIANATLKLAIDTDPAPVAVATMMNRALHGTGGPRAFMTLFYGLLTPDEGTLEYVCVGHPYPLLRRKDGELLRLGTGSLPLGMRAELELSTESVTLHPGDLLLMYTDGIPEAVGTHGEAFGFERLQDLLRAGDTPRQVHDRIVSELELFVGEEPVLDDRGLVVMVREA